MSKPRADDKLGDMTTRWLSEEEQRLWRLILEATRKLDRTIDDTLQTNYQLTSPEFSVLVNLSEAENQELRLRDLCTVLDWDRSRASHQITRMNKKGLVSKVKCEGDGRGIVVALTEEGERRLKEAVPGHVELVRSLVFDPMKPEHSEVLRDYLHTVLGSGACKQVIAESREAENG